MRRLLLALVALAIVVGAGAKGASAQGGPRMTEDQALRIFLDDAKVAAWLKHYPEGSVGSRLFFDERSRSWRVYVGNLLLGFELVMTHWHYLYILWFFPFVLLAGLGPDPPPAAAAHR